MMTMNHHKNYHTYRTKLQTCSPPLLPFIAIHLSDLTFINENDDKTRRHVTMEDPTLPPESPRIINRSASFVLVEEKKEAAAAEGGGSGGIQGQGKDAEGQAGEDEELLINFNKMELVSKVLNLLRGLQTVGYDRYQPATYLQKYFGGMEAAEDEKFSVWAEKDIYSRSLLVEPKVM